MFDIKRKFEKNQLINENVNYYKELQRLFKTGLFLAFKKISNK